MSGRQTHPLPERPSRFQPLYRNHRVNLQRLGGEAVIPLRGDISTNIRQVGLDQVEVTISNDWNGRGRRDTLMIQMMSATRFAENRERNRILRRAEEAQRIINNIRADVQRRERGRPRDVNHELMQSRAAERQARWDEAGRSLARSSRRTRDPRTRRSASPRPVPPPYEAHLPDIVISREMTSSTVPVPPSSPSPVPAATTPTASSATLVEEGEIVERLRARAVSPDERRRRPRHRCGPVPGVDMESTGAPGENPLSPEVVQRALAYAPGDTMFKAIDIAEHFRLCLDVSSGGCEHFHTMCLHEEETLARVMFVATAARVYLMMLANMWVAEDYDGEYAVSVADFHLALEQIVDRDHLSDQALIYMVQEVYRRTMMYPGTGWPVENLRPVSPSAWDRVLAAPAQGEASASGSVSAPTVPSIVEREGEPDSDREEWTLIEPSTSTPVTSDDENSKLTKIFSIGPLTSARAQESHVRQQDPTDRVQVKIEEE